MKALLLILFLFITAQAQTVHVPQGGSFQNALNQVDCGGTITLDAGVKYIGNFRLPKNCPPNSIAIRPVSLVGLPAEGVRVTPAHDALMPRILAPGNGLPVIEADAGAGGYRFIGIYISVDYGTDPAKKYHSSFLISLLNGNESNPNYGKWLSHDITFDRSHIAGKFDDARFAFAVAGFNLTVINSRIDEFANAGGSERDSAAFWFSNAGGHRLENNYISAGMWNIFMGGADSDSPNRAKVIASSLTSATLSEFEGTRPAIGDLVAFYIRPPGGESTWQPNTSYPLETIQFHHSAWTKEVGRPPLMFYPVQGGTSGTTQPDWNSFDEYHNQTKQDGTVVWRLFNGDFQVGQVTSIAGDTIHFAPEGGSGIFVPPVVGRIAKWNGYSPSLISRRNHYHRPAHWKQFNAPDKGMIQIKNASDVSFEGDMFTSDAQWPGLMSLTPGNQGYSAPWSTARRISIRNSYGDHLQGLFNFAMIDNKATGLIGEDVTIENNLFVRVGGGIYPDGTPDPYSGGVWQGHSAHKVKWVHNTVHNLGPHKLLWAYGAPNQQWIFRDSIMSMANTYNFCETGEPWTRCFPGADIRGNVVVKLRDEDRATWPAGTLFATDWPNVGLVNSNGNTVDDWMLRTDSPYKGKGSDGKDPGVDIVALKAALGGQFSPVPTPTPSPSPSPEMSDKRDSQKKRFIEALAAQGTVYHAALAAGVSRWTAYRWRQDDLEFASLWDEAIENAVDAVESVIYQQAVGGNTLAAIFYLKAHRGKYRDRLNIDIKQLHSEIEERIEQLRANPD